MKKWLIAACCLLAVFLNVRFPLTGRADDRERDDPIKNSEATEETDRPASAPDIEAVIVEIKKTGNIILSISPESMREIGYEPADVISVKIGDSEMEMPIGTNYSDVDSGEAICCMKPNSRRVEEVALAINAGSLASVMGIAEYQATDREPGYEWVFADGLDESATVWISMRQKQGYAEEYALHQLGRTRTNNRADYVDLSDEEYANFREVETSGMGRGTLFRSSSPVNPSLNRNTEADEALSRAPIQTVMNMVDTEEILRKYPDYGLTCYSACDVIALNMGMDFLTDDFQQKLAEGFRYLASHDGPYLIHCLEGKDRTGFAAAVLECLMGAAADEVIRDYMLTYYNFYGIEADTPQYEKIAEGNIDATLSKAFGISSIREEDADLSVRAEDYLRNIGMSEVEISGLKEKLAEDYGGLI